MIDWAVYSVPAGTSLPMRATISHSTPAFSGQPFSNTTPLCLMPLV